MSKKKDLEKKKKIEKLKAAAEAATTGKKADIARDVVSKVGESLRGITSKADSSKEEKRKAIETKAGQFQVRKLTTGTEEREASREKMVASRYKKDFDPTKVVPEDGPQPGVVGGGTFSLYAKNKRKK